MGISPLGRRPQPFDSMHQPLKFRLCVSEPVGRPHPVDTPAKRFKHRLAQPIAVARDLRRMIGRSARFTASMSSKHSSPAILRIGRTLRSKDAASRTHASRTPAAAACACATPRQRGASDGACAGDGNQIWSMDFVSDALFDERRLRALTLLDVFTREALAIKVDKGIGGEQVATILDAVLTTRPAPQRIRVDNGSEFVSNALDRWAYEHGVMLDFSRPGRPIDNAFVESFNGRFRKECLNAHWFLSLDDARAKIEAWWRFYNESRPHSALGDRTPLEFASLAGVNPGQ